jgi:queuosine precursor transporter
VLPNEQHHYPDLPPLSGEELHRRRELVFLIFVGLFLGSLVMLNLLGLTRFVDLSFTMPLVGWRVPMPLAVGVLPYPITFLCTDFISELFGRRRANTVVWIGFGLNLWVVLILWIGGALPGFEPPGQQGQGVFYEIRELTLGAVTASMIAYLTAQLIDVKVFHFWRRVTNGRHLWLRNNGSTLVSQLVDTVAVIVITHFWAQALPVIRAEPFWPQLLQFIAAGYVFKLVSALLDTGPFYLGTYHLTRALRLAPAHAAYRDESTSPAQPVI